MKILAITLALVFIIGMGVPYVDPGDEPLDGEPVGGNDQSAGVSGLGGAFDDFDPDFDYNDYTCDDCDEDDCTICNPPEYCYECGDCADCEVKYYCEECKDLTCPLCCGNDDCVDGCWICAELVCDDRDCGYCNDCNPLPVFGDGYGNKPTITRTSGSTDNDITDDFTDMAFRNYILSIFGAEPGGSISDTMVANIPHLTINDPNIRSLAGIEHFTSLDSIAITEESEITSLTIENVDALTALWIYSYTLNSLTLNNLPNLSVLEVANSQLSSISFTDLPVLERMGFYDNEFTTLTLPVLPALEYLWISGSLLTTLTLPVFPKLKYLDIQNTVIETLTLSDLPALETINLFDCNPITTLTLQNLSALENFQIISNSLKTLVLRNLPSLVGYSYGSASLTSLTLDNLPSLTSVGAYGSSLTILNMSNLPEVKSIDIHDTKLITLSLSMLPALTQASIYYNDYLSSLDFKGLQYLEYIYALHNRLTSIDITNTPELRDFYVAYNRLASFDSIIGLGGREDSEDFHFWFEPQSFDSVSEAITSGIFDEEPWPTIGLDDDTVITASDLQNIKSLGKGITIVLPNGISIDIDSSSITNAAKDVDLGTMDILWPVDEVTTHYGVSVPADSFVIIPPAAEGNYGFTISISGFFGFGYDNANAAANTTYNFIYINSSGAVTNYSANTTVERTGPFDNWVWDDEKEEHVIDGQVWYNYVTISFSHSSIYALWEIAPQTTTPPPGGPQMGDLRTLLLPGLMIAVGLIGLGGWMYFNKRNKKVTK
jgi:hypothetical protein